jgi:hypothetical protein
MIDEWPKPDTDGGRRLDREILVGRNRVEGHLKMPLSGAGGEMPFPITDGYRIEIYKINQEYIFDFYFTV